MFRQSFLYSLSFGAKGSYLKTGIAGKIVAVGDRKRDLAGLGNATDLHRKRYNL